MQTRDPRILVLRGGAIGDFILSLPALQALRREWPRAYIELIGYPHIANLAVEGGLVDKVFPLDRSDMARFFATGAAIPKEQAEYVRSFDFALSYMYDPDGTVCRNLQSTGIRQVLYCTPRVTSGHAADHFVRPLEALAIYPEGVPVPHLEVRDCTVAEGRRILAGFGGRAVVLHPGSGGRAKRWPVERFIALAAGIRRNGEEALFAIGEADADLVPALRSGGEAGRLLPGLSLVGLAGVLKCASAYIGNDSGVTHLAAAIGVPSVALFGATDPAVWGPRGRAVRILRGESAGAPSVEGLETADVAAALSEVRSRS